MSKFMYTANGSVKSNKQRIIESMTDNESKAPSDFFNLAGNLKLAGSVRATNFYKEDGTELESVVKMGLPENVYYIDKKLGINQENPMAALDVKGKARILGELGVDGPIGISGNLVSKGTGSFMGRVTAEDELMVGKHAGIGGNLGVAGNFGARGTSTFSGLLTAEDEFIANKNAGIGGNLGVAGNFGARGTSTFSGLLTAEDEFIANKNAGIGGNLGVAGNFGARGTSTFSGLVTAEDEFIANKNAGVRGNLGVAGSFSAQGPSNFRGLVTAEDEFIANKNAGVRGNLGVAGSFGAQGPSTFKGKLTAEDEIIGKSAVFAGRLSMGDAIILNGQDIPHPDVNDGAFYRADGQVQIAADDLIRLRHVGSKATGIQFDVRQGAGDIQNPNGQMKISRQGMLFGGPNADRETNSGQISAGLHIPNSLNIVGMSNDKGSASRRIDMWAEGGLNVYGNLSTKAIKASDNINVSNKTNEGGRIRILNELKNGQADQTNDWSIWNMTGQYGNKLSFWRYNGDGKNAGPVLDLYDNGEVAVTGKFKVPAASQICIGDSCVSEAQFKQLALSSSTTSIKNDYMYAPQEALIYTNIFDALASGVIAKSGNPGGWNDTLYKTSPWNGRYLLHIGGKNPFPNGLLVNVPEGKSVIWISLLSDRWQSFEVYKKDGSPLGNFTSGFRLSNRFNPDGSFYSLNPNVHTWMPIPVPGPGQYVICGGNKKNDAGNDCWISGIAFSSNPWAHAMNSAVAYHWLVNDGTPNPTWVNHNVYGDQQARLDMGKVYTLNVPVVKSGKDKLLYFVLLDNNMNSKITVNDKPIDRLAYSNDTPFAKFFNSRTNNFVSAKIPADVVTTSGFLKVVVDLTGINTDINFREIGTIDMP